MICLMVLFRMFQLDADDIWFPQRTRFVRKAGEVLGFFFSGGLASAGS